jgi:hypothetical protein
MWELAKAGLKAWITYFEKPVKGDRIDGEGKTRGYL